MKRLAQRKKRRYSYRAIIAPEHLGTVFYLENLPEKVVKTFRGGMFLEMLGHQNRFALQKSFTGESLIDKAAKVHLARHFSDFHEADFRKVVGNDETVWEAPGFEIPFVSLSRAHPMYPEYHSSLDDERIIFEDKLEEAVQAVLGILEILE